MTLPAHARAEVQRILDGAARRILEDRVLFPADYHRAIEAARVEVREALL